jgi:signal transduction histidine kinase
VENIENGDSCFCLFTNQQEIDYFLKTSLAHINITRYLFIFSNTKSIVNKFHPSITDGFNTINIGVPKTKSKIWKTQEFEKLLVNIFDKIKTPNHHTNYHIFLDFSKLKISKSIVESIESSFEEKLAKYNLNYFVYSIYLEKKLSKKLINQLVLRYETICLKGALILPNFYYDSDTKGEFPSSFREIYQPIEVLYEEIQRSSLEENRMSKELFMVKTNVNVLESSLATLLAIDKGKTKLQKLPTDLVSLIDYHDLKRRYDQKSQILSTVIHDLKSPLAAIQGFAELLRDGLVAPITLEIRKHLEIIISNAKRLSRMIESILEYETYDQSDYLVQRETFDIVDLIDEAKMSILPQMIQKGHNMEIYSPDALEIVANRELLHRVLQNILDNSVKYSPQEKGKIELFVDEINFKGQRNIQITVKDNGYGFSKANLKKAFTPFTHFEPGSTSTGLGLSITKKIVEDLHGGIIEIASPGRNKGTTVTILLPKT